MQETNKWLFLPALAISVSLICPSRGADDPVNEPESKDLAAEVVVLKHAYNETRIGFTKLRQSPLEKLERLLARQLKSGDLAGANRRGLAGIA